MVRCNWKRTFISEVKAATAAVSITCFTSAVLRSGVDRLAPVAPVAGAVGVLAAHLNHVYAAHIWHGDLCPQNPHRILKLRTFLELIKETTRIPNGKCSLCAVQSEHLSSLLILWKDRKWFLYIFGISSKFWDENTNESVCPNPGEFFSQRTAVWSHKRHTSWGYIRASCII